MVNRIQQSDRKDSWQQGKMICNDTAKVGEFENNAELESRNGKR